MASLALLGRGPVEKHVLALHHPNLFVAPLASDVFVQTLQGKRTALVVIEE